MRDKVIAFIQQHSLLPASGPLIVAFSGGADSLCLLHILYMLCGPQKQYPTTHLHVAHLDHQLRGTASEQDALHISQLASAWGLPCTIGAIDVPALAQQEHRSLEDAARTARYRFLREVAHGQLIAVAHHQDDQVETLLLHWIRGGGIASQVGLQPRQQDIIRPLLAVTHGETLAYCEQHRLIPLQDASNSDTRFYRNRIRHELLPLIETMNADFRATLLRNAEVLHVDVNWIEAQVDTAWQQVVLEAEASRCTLALSHLCTLSQSIQRHLLRRVTSRLSAGQSPLELRHYLLIEELLQRETTIRDVSLDLPDNLTVTKTRDTLTFQRQKKEDARNDSVPTIPDIAMLDVPGRVTLQGTAWTAIAELLSAETTHKVKQLLQVDNWQGVWQILPATPDRVYLDAVWVGSHLSLRARRAGDTMQPLGMRRQKKVQNILIDKHIPRTQRDTLPLFFNAMGYPVWLGGVCVDERARLTRDTQHIVCLHLMQTC